MCQVHPVLVKTGQMYGPFFVKNFFGRIPGPVSCHCLESGWFVGDPTSLARDNI